MLSHVQTHICSPKSVLLPPPSLACIVILPYVLLRPLQWQNDLLNCKDQFFSLWHQLCNSLKYNSFCNPIRDHNDLPLVCANIFGKLYMYNVNILFPLKTVVGAEQTGQMGRYWAVPNGTSQLKYLLMTLLMLLTIFTCILFYKNIVY